MRHLHLPDSGQVLPADVAKMRMDKLGAIAPAQRGKKSRRWSCAESLRDPFGPKPPISQITQGVQPRYGELSQFSVRSQTTCNSTADLGR